MLSGGTIALSLDTIIVLHVLLQLLFRVLECGDMQDH